jgi:hypothetical protein
VHAAAAATAAYVTTTAAHATAATAAYVTTTAAHATAAHATAAHATAAASATTPSTRGRCEAAAKSDGASKCNCCCSEHGNSPSQACFGALQMIAEGLTVPERIMLFSVASATSWQKGSTRASPCPPSRVLPAGRGPTLVQKALRAQHRATRRSAQITNATVSDRNVSAAVLDSRAGQQKLLARQDNARLNQSPNAPSSAARARCRSRDPHPRPAGETFTPKSV